LCTATTTTDLHLKTGTVQEFVMLKTSVMGAFNLKSHF